jgi:cytochrome d ubiquinol oxidase subunit I
MDPLLAARAQMEVSLGFHMVFAALGIGMPLLMVIAESLWLATKKPHYRDLARKWGKVTAVLFAIGAVSGTALSFELGLLWPHFMRLAGGAIGPAFALEGYAFFLEAIFVGLYVFGWDRLSPRGHLLCGIPVAVAGMLSGVLVVAANAWMQVPGGGRFEGGELVELRAAAAFGSPVWATMSVHSTLSCYIAVGFAVAGVYAHGILHGKRDLYHHTAIQIALGVAAISAVLQVVSGDSSAKAVARYEPAKLAAMEAQFETARGVPLLIGGIPDEKTGTVHWAIRIPGALSFLATGDSNAELRGLSEYPEHANVILTHTAFQIMVGCGFVLVAMGALYWGWQWRIRRRRRDEPRLLMRVLVLGSPLGFLALEAGWTVTEAGRQPWIVGGILRTRDAVTPNPWTGITFVGFSLLYFCLAVVLVTLLRHLARVAAGDRSGAGEPHAT